MAGQLDRHPKTFKGTGVIEHTGICLKTSIKESASNTKSKRVVIWTWSTALPNIIQIN